MNKDQYLAKFHDERLRWQALLAEVGESHMSQAGVVGDWTFKDLVAHLTGWRERAAMRIEMGCGIEAENPPWWPDDIADDDDSDAAADRVNQVIYDLNRGRTVHDVLADSERVLRQVEDGLRELSDEALNSTTCFAWTEGKPLAEIDLFGHWHTEHEPQVREWLTKIDGTKKW